MIFGIGVYRPSRQQVEAMKAQVATAYHMQALLAALPDEARERAEKRLADQRAAEHRESVRDGFIKVAIIIGLFFVFFALAHVS
jgi:hypothetical protein